MIESEVTLMIVVDGQSYADASAVPNFGSIECIGVDGAKRDYIGLEVDKTRLPKYDNLAGGSSCLMLDTGRVYMYLAYNKTWYGL